MSVRCGVRYRACEMMRTGRIRAEGERGKQGRGLGCEGG